MCLSWERQTLRTQSLQLPYGHYPEWKAFHAALGWDRGRNLVIWTNVFSYVKIRVLLSSLTCPSCTTLGSEFVFLISYFVQVLIRLEPWKIRDYWNLSFCYPAVHAEHRSVCVHIVWVDVFVLFLLFLHWVVCWSGVSGRRTEHDLFLDWVVSGNVPAA